MKTILIDNEIVMEMSFEDVLEKFEPIIKKNISKWNNFDCEELYQIGLISLWKAYKNYSVETNTYFGKYASILVQRDTLNYLRDTYKNRQTTSIINISYEDCKDYIDYLHKGKENIFEDNMLEFICMKDLIEQLPKLEKTIIKLYYLEDKFQSEIGDFVNLSQPYVHKILNKTTKYLNKKYKSLIV